MSVSYKIRITQSVSENKRLQTYQKVADTGNEKDGGPVYGYVEYDGVKTTDTDIYEQVVETLDVAAVIRAVNGMGE